MINEIDINSLTPLDSLLKGEYLRNIEYYTYTLSQIKEKYCKENSLINTKIKTYILLNFDIIKSEISIDKSYNEFLKSQIKKLNQEIDNIKYNEFNMKKLNEEISEINKKLYKIEVDTSILEKNIKNNDYLYKNALNEEEKNNQNVINKYNKIRRI